MIVSLWITIGLVLASISVASLGAYFSITGLGVLFSGALVAVWLMAGSLEFAKFMLAAYLHQTWKNQNVVYKSYLTFAIVTLSIITSIGIYGFLSDAYTSSSSLYETETAKIENFKTEQATMKTEIARLNAMVDEVPDRRITKKMKLRAEVEPLIQELNKKFAISEKLLAESNLKIIQVKRKVGPLMYVAKNFNADIDRVVSYLILILVSVFDPLAICLVIASTHAISSHKEAKQKQLEEEAEQPRTEKIKKPTEDVTQTMNQNTQAVVEPEDIIVQMNFKDESEDKKAI